MEENNNQNDHVENNDLVPHLKTMTAILNKMVLQGYEDDFKMNEDGDKLISLKTERTFEPQEIKIVNFFRFEGQSDPNDSSILYVVETTDGLKGTIVDAYGPYSDRNLSEFIQKVENIYKKTEKEDPRP